MFIKGYAFLSLLKAREKNIGKSLSKNLSGKYGQRLLDHANQTTDEYKNFQIKQKILDLIEKYR